MHHAKITNSTRVSNAVRSVLTAWARHTPSRSQRGSQIYARVLGLRCTHSAGWKRASHRYSSFDAQFGDIQLVQPICPKLPSFEFEIGIMLQELNRLLTTFEMTDVRAPFATKMLSRTW